MNTTIIPKPATARKGMSGQYATNYIYLSDRENPGGSRPCLKVHTSKSSMGITTSYSFGYHKFDRGFDCFSSMIMSDYSSRMSHAASRATAKAITDAHSLAMMHENVEHRIEAAALQHDINL